MKKITRTTAYLEDWLQDTPVHDEVQRTILHSAILRLRLAGVCQGSLGRDKRGNGSADSCVSRSGANMQAMRSHKQEGILSRLARAKPLLAPTDRNHN